MSLFSFPSSPIHLAVLTSEIVSWELLPKRRPPRKFNQLSEALPCYAISRINSRMLHAGDASTGKTYKVNLIRNLPILLTLAQKAKYLPNSRKINHFKEVTEQEERESHKQEVT